MGWLHRADVYLDTIGFSGFNTALYAVESGLPIVAREGRFLRGRLASGILKRLELHELVAPTEQGYVDLAVKLAQDPDYRQSISRRMESARDTLYEDVGAIRAMEEFMIRVAPR
jgi:predicted O-linked N-acetylglucosamine transferase (SPINDLY family)